MAEAMNGYDMNVSLSPKQRLFEQFARVASALANPRRLELLEQLAQGERSVEVVAGRVGLSVANASQHLQQLRRAGLINARRDGKFVFYCLAGANVLDLLAALHTVAENNLAEVDAVLRTFFDDRDSLEPVSREVLLRRTQGGLVTVLDVRPPDEFALGHISQAVNIPLAEMELRLDELDPAREIVAYCRGSYCVLSFEAVAMLRERGFTVRRLVEGYPEWAAAGLPVEEAAR